jgi:hypothetical protein
MNTWQLMCPKCRRTFERVQPGIAFHCSCGTLLQAPWPTGHQSPANAARRPPWLILAIAMFAGLVFLVSLCAFLFSRAEGDPPLPALASAGQLTEPPAVSNEPSKPLKEVPKAVEVPKTTDLPKATDKLRGETKRSREVARRVKTAGGRIGVVTVSLAWNNYNDLDLHVVTAAGAEIFYGQRRSPCGGWLDIDQNVLPRTTTPVENVFWTATRPPNGPFKIYVVHYRNHLLPGCEDPTAFVVRVQVGDRVRLYEGSVRYSQSIASLVALQRLGIPLPAESAALVAEIHPSRFTVEDQK